LCGCSSVVPLFVGEVLEARLNKRGKRPQPVRVDEWGFWERGARAKCLRGGLTQIVYIQCASGRGQWKDRKG